MWTIFGTTRLREVPLNFTLFRGFFQLFTYQPYLEQVVQIYSSRFVRSSSFADLNCYKLNSADAVQYWRNVTGRIDCITNCRNLSGEKRFFCLKRGMIFKYFIPSLLHLPPLGFYCVGGCWDWTQDCCNACIVSQTLYPPARYHP